MFVRASTDASEPGGFATRAHAAPPFEPPQAPRAADAATASRGLAAALHGAMHKMNSQQLRAFQTVALPVALHAASVLARAMLGPGAQTIQAAVVFATNGHRPATLMAALAPPIIGSSVWAGRLLAMVARALPLGTRLPATVAAPAYVAAGQRGLRIARSLGATALNDAVRACRAPSLAGSSCAQALSEKLAARTAAAPAYVAAGDRVLRTARSLRANALKDAMRACRAPALAGSRWAQAVGEKLAAAARTRRQES